MSKYNVGDKFIIEIGEVFTGDCSIRNRLEERYAIKGFNALMFDNTGLDRLQRYDGNTYLDGVQAGLESLDCSVRNAYEKGLSDAWELAKKIALNEDDGGISTDDLKKIFNIELVLSSPYWIFKNLTPHEALGKLEAYEKELEEIKVGDIVYNDSTLEEGVITHIDHDEVFMLYSDGSCGLAEGNLTKTGKRFDVADVLNVLKEKEKE